MLARIPITHRALIEKANLALEQLAIEGGYMPPETSDRFRNLAIPEASMLAEAVVIPMRSPEYLIPKHRFASRVLRAGTQGVALSENQRATPQFAMKRLQAKTYKVEVDFTMEVLEDNIELEGYLQTMVMSLAPRIGLDLEEVFLLGDTDNVVDPVLALNDGWLKRANTIVYDHLGDAPNLDLWTRMVKLMPPEFQRLSMDAKWYSAFNLKHDWRANLAGRIGPLGDQMLQGQGGELAPLGFPIKPVVNIPDTSVYGNAANYSTVLFTSPNNLVVGMHTQVKVLLDLDVREGMWTIVIRMRVDNNFFEDTAVVKGQNILAGASSVNIGGSSTAVLTPDSPTPDSDLGYTIDSSALNWADTGTTFLPSTTGAGLGVDAPELFP